MNALFRCERPQPRFSRNLDIDGQAIGISPGIANQPLVGLGNGLQVDVAAKVVNGPQRARNVDELLHRVIRIADDPR